MSNHECDKCNKKFKSYNGCYRHKKRNNCLNLKVNCPHCFSGFKHKTNLREGLTTMWQWAKNQDERGQFIWPSFEIDKNLYSYWKKEH